VEMLLSYIEFSENRPLSGYSSGGELYFAVGDGFFPEENWYDCAFQDLKTWIPRLISFGSNHTDSCEFFFMDGPYTIRLNRREDGSVYADCLRDHKSILLRQNVDLPVLLKSALSCCRKYDRFLFEKGKPNQFTHEIRLLKTLLDT